MVDQFGVAPTDINMWKSASIRMNLLNFLIVAPKMRIQNEPWKSHWISIKPPFSLWFPYGFHMVCYVSGVSNQIQGWIPRMHLQPSPSLSPTKPSVSKRQRGRNGIEGWRSSIGCLQEDKGLQRNRSFHRHQTRFCPGKHGVVWRDCCPPVICYIAIQNGHRHSGFTELRHGDFL